MLIYGNTMLMVVVVVVERFIIPDVVLHVTMVARATHICINQCRYSVLMLQWKADTSTPHTFNAYRCISDMCSARSGNEFGNDVSLSDRSICTCSIKKPVHFLYSTNIYAIHSIVPKSFSNQPNSTHTNTHTHLNVHARHTRNDIGRHKRSRRYVRNR